MNKAKTSISPIRSNHSSPVRYQEVADIDDSQIEEADPPLGMQSFFHDNGHMAHLLEQSFAEGNNNRASNGTSGHYHSSKHQQLMNVSFAANPDSPRQRLAASSLNRSSAGKNQGPESGKKSALYRKIMREHSKGPGQGTSPAKLDYEIKALPPISSQMQMNNNSLENNQHLSKSSQKLQQANNNNYCVGQGQLKLTETKPFNFKTSQRAKLTENGPDTPKPESYEGLQQQIKNAFILRADEPSSASKYSPRKLTKAQSPDFETTKRLQLRSTLQQDLEDSEHQNSTMSDSNFKAMPFNKKIFERQSALPSVNKRASTTFTEFSLSQPNSNLGKRTLREYMADQDKMAKAAFKAQDIDKRVFQNPKLMNRKSIDPSLGSTQVLAFNFETERRNQKRKSVSPDKKEANEENTRFKAKEMPNYKFFQPARNSLAAKKLPLFEEFNLSTSKRQKTNSSIQEFDEAKCQFKAKKMPDFSQTQTQGLVNPGITNVIQPKRLTEPQPFKFASEERPRKSSVANNNFQEEQNVHQQFHAQPIKAKLGAEVQIGRQSVSSRKTPRTVPVEFKLPSQERAAKRQEYNLTQKEREFQLKQEQEQLRLECEAAEAQELKLLREQISFKATPVRHFKMGLGSVDQKELTVPNKPEFQTDRRAALREPLEDDQKD